MTEGSLEGQSVRRRRTTIRDVARAADVSITTVSHVLSGHGRVSQETRERVLDAVMRSGYRANAHAQHLVTQHSRTLTIQVSSTTDALAHGTLIPDSEYFLEVLNGAAQAAAELDYALVLTPAGPLHFSDVRFTADGAVLVDPTGDEPYFTDRRLSDVRLVTTGRRPADTRTGSVVDNNHVRSATVLLDHLRAHSYERPAFITSATTRSYTFDLVTGYLDWTRAHAITPRLVELDVPPTREAALHAMLKLLDGPAAPDAVMTSSEELAVGALHAALARGLAAPQDIGICSAVDGGVLQLLATPITGMYLNPRTIGRRSVELLVRQLTDDDQVATVEIPTELRVRASTARVTATGL